MSFIMFAAGSTSGSRLRTVSTRALLFGSGLAAVGLLTAGAGVGYWMSAPLQPVRAVQEHAASALPFAVEQLGALSGRLFKLESQAGQLSERIGVKQGAVPKTEIPKVADTGAAKIYLIDRPGSVQTNLLAGTLTIERTDPDYFALEMMNQVVGGGPSARLFMNLREDKGYTYGAYSNVSSFKYRGRFQANTEVRTDVTEGSMKELLYEFKRIGEEKIPADEFERAKRTIIGGWALQLESPASSLQNAITSRLYGLPADYWDTYPQKIAAITTNEVQRVARKYLDLGKLQIVAVGDATKIASLLKQFGKVEIFDTEGKPKAAATASNGTTK